MRERWDRASWSSYCLPVCVDVHQHGSAACKNNLAPSARLKHRRPDSEVITIHHQYGPVKRTMDARSAATNERKFFLRWTKAGGPSGQMPLRQGELGSLPTAAGQQERSLNPELNLAVRRFHRT